MKCMFLPTQFLWTSHVRMTKNDYVTRRWQYIRIGAREDRRPHSGGAQREADLQKAVQAHKSADAQATAAPSQDSFRQPPRGGVCGCRQTRLCLGAKTRQHAVATQRVREDELGQWLLPLERGQMRMGTLPGAAAGGIRSSPHRRKNKSVGRQREAAYIMHQPKTERAQCGGRRPADGGGISACDTHHEPLRRTSA